MAEKLLAATAWFCLLLWGCKDNYNDIQPDATMEFAQRLSSYAIYQLPRVDLLPDSGFLELELNSALYSDNAHKQRLIRLPEGTNMFYDGGRLPNFPDGCMLVKTFYYPSEVANPDQGNQVIETRLMVKNEGVWNAATYLWDEDQDDAILVEDGASVNVEYVSDNGSLTSLLYQVPAQRKCAKCHQSSMELVPLGATVRNWNREVVRDGQTVHQLVWLQAKGALNPFDVLSSPQIPDYNSQDVSLEERTRAYLDMNCSSCHNPEGIEEAQVDGLDFRFETPLDQTGIGDHATSILRNMEEGRMPDEGLVTVDTAGLTLIREYVESL